MPDQSASQTLYEALKTFLSAPPAPHPWWYDVLKDFQPLLAAAAALFAAGLAFRASMAKVWFDADEATKKRKAERLAVYLRLQMATGRLQGRIRDILERPETEVEQMEERALVLEISPAIDEIEERLDLFNRADGYALQCQTGLFKVKRPFGWALGRRQWESPAMPADAVRPFTLILLSAALLSGCGENNSARQNEPPPPSVSVSEPVRKMVTEWDEFTGRFQAVDHVSIRPRVSGYLQSAHFQEGSMVKKGDLLFVIDPRPYEAVAEEEQGRLQTAQSQLTFASRDLERAVELGRTQAVSQQVIDQRRQAMQAAEDAVITAEGALKRAKLDVEFTRVVSPIDGRIGRKLVTEGNLVSGGDTSATLLTTVVSLDPIYLYFNLDEQTYLKNSRLRLATQPPTSQDDPNAVHVALPDDTAFPYEGRMDWIDNELDPGTGTLRGRAILPNPQLLFSPGQFGRVRLMGSAPYEAMLLPDSAIGSDQSRKIVYVVGKNDVVELREVKLGRLIDGLRVLHEGLKPDETVVISGLQRVRAGGRVTPTRKQIADTSGAGAQR